MIKGFLGEYFIERKTPNPKHQRQLEIKIDYMKRDKKILKDIVNGKIENYTKWNYEELANHIITITQKLKEAEHDLASYNVVRTNAPNIG